MELYYIREYERLLKYRYYACSKAAGTLIEQSVTVLDLKGIGMSIIGGKVKIFIFYFNFDFEKFNIDVKILINFQILKKNILG